jgi:hypothetical protein
VDERPPPLPASMSASRSFLGMRSVSEANYRQRLKALPHIGRVADSRRGPGRGGSRGLATGNDPPSAKRTQWRALCNPHGQSRRPFAADRRTGGVHKAAGPALSLVGYNKGYLATPSPRGVLGTSLYDDPAAELHDDASARLREHPALIGCSILRRSSPGSGVSGYQDPAGGHDEGAVANHRERPVSRDTALRVSCRIRIRFLGFRAGTRESSVSPAPARTIRWIARHFGDPAAACWRQQDPGARAEGCWRTVIRRAPEGSAVSDEPEDHWGQLTGCPDMARRPGSGETGAAAVHGWPQSGRG